MSVTKITKSVERGIMERVKKFGLNHHDLPTMVWNINFLFKFIGLDIDPKHKKPTGFLCWMWMIFFFGCYCYIYFISMIWFVFWRCRETGDIVNAVLVFSLGVASEISVTKFFYILFRRKTIGEIVGDYLKCDSQVVPGSRFAENLKPTLRAAKKRAIIVWIVFLWNGIIYILIPLFKSGRQMPEENFQLFGVKDMKAYPDYEILFAVNAVGVIVGTAYLAANVMAFHIILTGYSEAQTLALSEEIIHLWNDAVTQYNNINTENQDVNSDTRNLLLNKDNRNGYNKEGKIINDLINRKLTKIVKMHVIIINLLKKFENMFRGTVVIEFILVVMCLIAELLGGLDKTFIQLPFSLLFLLSNCVAGQRIIDASKTFENSVYCCNWENFDVRNRKIVLLMLQNSQKTMTLSAGGVTVLSRETFMKVVNSIYTAYTTLRSAIN